MNRLIYAAPADLSEPAAHNVHIVRMCEALAVSGSQVSLIVRDAPDWAQIAGAFDLGAPFQLDRVRTSARRLGSAQFAHRVLQRTRRGDAVITRHLPTACLLAARGRAVVLELHAPPANARGDAMLRFLSRRPGFTGLVVVTRALAGHFQAMKGLDLEDRLHVLPDAATPRPLGGGEALGLSRPAVGYVGSFLPGKGVEIIARIADALPEVQFYLVGGTAEEAQPHTSEGRPNFVSVGRVPHAEAVAWVDAFDIVLLPNQRRVIVSDGSVDIGPWTSPLKLFEYMAAGKAIVASRLAVLQEVLEHGRNCLLASPEDPADWVEKISLLLARPEQAAALGRQARADFLANYTWQGRANRILEILDEAKGHET
jgi:glycosyltransferase involved in cell wall biosynthesis